MQLKVILQSFPNKQRIAKGQKLHQIFLRRCFHLSSSIQKDADSSDSDNNYDPSRDWVPPQRPLSGDLGQSEVYATKIKTKSNFVSSTQTIDDNFLTKVEPNKNVGVEVVDSFDLDDLDMESLRTLLEAQEGGSNKNISFVSKGYSELEEGEDWEDSELEGEDWDDSELEDEDIDYDDLFENDEVIKEIMSDLQADDKEMYDLKMEMIEERLQEIRKDKAVVVTPEKVSVINESNNFINKDNAELDEFLKLQNLQNNGSNSNNNSSSSPDWLSTRRSKLSPSDILTPAESSKAHRLDSEIPIIKNTLLSSKEIITCLTNLGGNDVVLVTPDEKTLPYLGWNGLIIATGSSYSHIRVLTDAIVANLRKRNLANKGIVGALYGSEGGEDATSSKKRRGGMPKKMDDGWISVDCGNFIVHVQDDMNRRSIDLEGLWSPGERGRAGKELRSIDREDEDAVEDYVANNPVPSAYTESLIDVSGDFWGDGQSRGGFGNILGKNNGRWTPRSNEKKKTKNRGKW